MASWREVTMHEAVRFIRDGAGQPLNEVPEWAAELALPESNRNELPDVEWFSDGTAVACASDWDGPWSEATPDTDANPPQWWIYA